MREVYVELGVGMAYDAGAAVWSFDPDLWGTCIQGPTAEAAIGAFERRHGPVATVEQIKGDERAFDRDRLPASDTEITLTLGRLTRLRHRSLHLLQRLPPDLLDRDDPARRLPSWARWRTIRGTLWHITDTESRYYLPALGLPGNHRANDLDRELRLSAAHVRHVVSDMTRDLVVEEVEVWTSTKLLRRLAWHEAGELDAIEGLLTTWATR